MLILNNIDIVQTDANRINCHSTHVEPKQHHITTSPVLDPFSTTPQNSFCCTSSSLVYSHEDPINTPSTLKQVENETSVPISQINPYINR